MNNKNTGIILVLFTLLLTFSNASAMQMWGNFMGNYSNYMNNTTSSNTSTGTSSDDDSQSDDEDDVNSDVSEDMKFEKDWNIWANADVNANIVAEKNLKIWANATVNGNIIVKWNLDIWAWADITWYVKVNGVLTIWANATVNGTIYGYNKITAWANADTFWKLKSAWTFTAGASYDWEWKLYAFWGKKFSAASEFVDKKEKWILGRLDAYLLIDISNEDFEVVKKLAATYDTSFAWVLSDIKKTKVAIQVANGKLKLAKTTEEKASAELEVKNLNDKLSSLKNTGKDLIEKLIVETEQYIEDEDYDKKWVNVYLKNEELAKLELNQSVAKDIIVKTEEKSQKIEDKQENKQEIKEEVKQEQKTNVNSKSNEKLKNSIRVMLERKLAKFDEAKKTKVFETLLSKLDNLIEKTQSEKTKNTLIALKEVVIEMQEEANVWTDIDSLLNWVEEPSQSNTQNTTEQK